MTRRLPSLWGSSSSVGSAGYVSADTIQNYIEHQQRSETMRQVFKYKLYPPRQHAVAMRAMRETHRRLDQAFQAFFRRVKAGETPDYPRFTGRNRFDTVAFPSVGDGCRFDGRYVYFQPIGRVKIKRHHPTEGQIKPISCTREADGWYVVCSCDLGAVTVTPADGPAVGIDLGLNAFLVSSEGARIAPPQH